MGFGWNCDSENCIAIPSDWHHTVLLSDDIINFKNDPWQYDMTILIYLILTANILRFTIWPLVDQFQRIKLKSRSWAFYKFHYIFLWLTDLHRDIPQSDSLLPALKVRKVTIGLMGHTAVFFSHCQIKGFGVILTWIGDNAGFEHKGKTTTQSSKGTSSCPPQPLSHCQH